MSVRPFSLPQASPPPEILRVTLAPLPDSEPPPLDQEPPEKANDPIETPPIRTEEPRESPITESPPESSSVRAPPTAVAGPPPIDLAQLRRQLAERDVDEESASEPGPPGARQPSRSLPWSERGEAIRGLPLSGGWLNPYVGPVQPVSQTWGSQIGERRGYYVLANGQAVCTRTPAPSFSELIHPWKAMRVTLAWDCGRARGTAPPPDDLDYAPAPAALREAADRTMPSGTAEP